MIVPTSIESSMSLTDVVNKHNYISINWYGKTYPISTKFLLNEWLISNKHTYRSEYKHW